MQRKNPIFVASLRMCQCRTEQSKEEKKRKGLNCGGDQSLEHSTDQRNPAEVSFSGAISWQVHQLCWAQARAVSDTQGNETVTGFHKAQNSPEPFHWKSRIIFL